MLSRMTGAGMLDEDGRLSRPLQVRKAGPPPFVELVDTDGNPALCFRPITKGESAGVQNPEILIRGWSEPDLKELIEFINLGHREPEQFLAFAKKWGRLHGLCKHLVPFLFCHEGCKDYGEESINYWRVKSLEMGSLLRLATNLHDDKPGDAEDWTFLTEARVVAELYMLPKSELRHAFGGCSDIEVERSIIGLILDELLFESGARLSFEWSTEANPARMFLSPSQSLLALLTCQLAFAISRVYGVATCDSCSQAYSPKRKPQLGRKRYCEDCRSSAPAREYERKKRLAIRLGDAL